MSNLIQTNSGILTTNTWIIAQEFKLKHSNVIRELRRLINEESLTSAQFEHILVKDKHGRRQNAIELTERGFLIAMPFICGRKGRQGQIALVDEFIRLRKQAGIQQYFIEMTDDEQASTCGKGLANRRWGKPVFDLQLVLPLEDTTTKLEGCK